MEVREDRSAAAHSFFSLARLFMSQHPIIGGAHVARALGDYQPFRPGWNVKNDDDSEEYVWIDPGGGEGLTTRMKPEGVPDAEIYRKPPEPPFVGSDAHVYFNRAVSGLAAELGDGAAQTDIYRIHHDVLRAAGVELGRLDEWTGQIMRAIDGKVRESLAGPQPSLAGVLGPANELVTDYLKFSVPGRVARAVLASYLVFLIDLFPSPSLMMRPPLERSAAALEARRAERLVSLFKHLRERTASLLFERKAYDLPSFYDMTYLAVLLGDVGLMIGRMLLDRVGVSGEQRTQISRHQRMLEEELAHLAKPTFLYPALFCKSFVPGIRKLPHPQPFVYPQLDGANVTPRDPAKVFRLLGEKTAGLPRYDVLASLDEKNRIMDEENLQELMQGLLFLVFGRQ